MTVSGGEVYPLVATPKAEGEGSAADVAVPETVEEGLPAAPDGASGDQ
jgi:hypothetical protein